MKNSDKHCDFYNFFYLTVLAFNVQVYYFKLLICECFRICYKISFTQQLNLCKLTFLGHKK